MATFALTKHKRKSLTIFTPGAAYGDVGMVNVRPEVDNGRITPTHYIKLPPAERRARVGLAEVDMHIVLITAKALRDDNLYCKWSKQLQLVG